MTEADKPIPDNHLYELVNFSSTALKLFVDALRHYQRLLETDIQELQQEEFIAQILPQETIGNLPIAQEISRIKRYADILEEKLQKAGDWGAVLSIYHGDVRFLKSVTELYLNEIRVKRDSFARSRRVSKAALEALDTRIAELAEKNKGGIFQRAELVPLLVNPRTEDIEESSPPVEAPASPRAPQGATSTLTPIYGIELLDPELRQRCLDLLEQRLGDSDKLDTIISEATRVLEHRIRLLSGADSTLSGLDLVTHAFGGNAPRIQLGENPAERDAAHLLFRGVFGFIRNPFHHRIIPINRERVIQLLGLVDYLLYVLENAAKTPSGP